MSTDRIGSLKLNVIGASEAMKWLGSRLSSPTQGSACFGFLNPHVYNHCGSDRRVAAFLERCRAVCLDGIGVAAVGRIQNRRWLPRVTMYQVFDAVVAAGLLRGRLVILGLSADDCAQAVRQLKAAAPQADFVGCYHGFLSDHDYRVILRDYSHVDAILVGMGTPRSEHILLQASEICDRALCWHVGGGTLRQWAGTKRCAPELVSQIGLEWLHRMVFEPEVRMRYVTDIPLFVGHILTDCFVRSGGPKSG
jgi:exopolysaccharide biosynthesis WecB/TagA/CpsF family protein